jgi:peptidase M24-like protein
MIKKLTGCLITLVMLGALFPAPPVSGDGFPVVMSMRERAAAQNAVTLLRLDTLLPRVMRETGLDMWIIPCNEDNYDPVFLTMIPFDAWCPITQILVFYDPGPGKAVQRLNVSRTDMQGLHEKVWTPFDRLTNEGEEQWACLARLVRERDPKRIGINISGDIWAAGGLTVALHQKLVKAIGPKYTGRLESAEKASVLWLETLLDEDLDLYEAAVAVSHALIAETFSNQVITPGVTTVDDLVFHYRQRTANLGLEKSFRPFFRIRGRGPDMLKKFPITDKVIRRGDILHCDVGVKYLRYHTDTQ